jgi:hypothetical protein
LQGFEGLSLQSRPAADSLLPGNLDYKLLNLASQGVDGAGNVGAQRFESDNRCQRDERCGNCVFRKFKTGFITEKSLNHFVAPFRFD